MHCHFSILVGSLCWTPWKSAGLVLNYLGTYSITCIILTVFHQSFYSQKGMLVFDSAQFDGILKKITEFNNALLSDQVVVYIIKCFRLNIHLFICYFLRQHIICSLWVECYIDFLAPPYMLHLF